MMLVRICWAATLSLSVIWLSGCATVTRGTEQTFQVITTPPGATVMTTLERPASREARKVDPSIAADNYTCAPTPCGFDVPRKASFIAHVSKDGYQSVPIIVRPKSELAAIGTSAVGPTPAIGLATASTAASAGGVGLAGTTFLATGFGTLIAAPAIVVDSSNGSMLSLYPNPVEITLRPNTDGSVSSTGRIVSETGIIDPS